MFLWANTSQPSKLFSIFGHDYQFECLLAVFMQFENILPFSANLRKSLVYCFPVEAIISPNLCNSPHILREKPEAQKKGGLEISHVARGHDRTS